MSDGQRAASAAVPGAASPRAPSTEEGRGIQSRLSSGDAAVMFKRQRREQDALADAAFEESMAENARLDALAAQILDEHMPGPSSAAAAYSVGAAGDGLPFSTAALLPGSSFRVVADAVRIQEVHAVPLEVRARALNDMIVSNAEDRAQGLEWLLENGCYDALHETFVDVPPALLTAVRSGARPGKLRMILVLMGAGAQLEQEFAQGQEMTTAVREADKFCPGVLEYLEHARKKGAFVAEELSASARTKCGDLMDDE
jgi:hypothetical protein